MEDDARELERQEIESLQQFINDRSRSQMGAHADLDDEEATHLRDLETELSEMLRQAD